MRFIVHSGMASFFYIGRLMFFTLRNLLIFFVCFCLVVLVLPLVFFMLVVSLTLYLLNMFATRLKILFGMLGMVISRVSRVCL